MLCVSSTSKLASELFVFPIYNITKPVYMHSITTRKIVFSYDLATKILWKEKNSHKISTNTNLWLLHTFLWLISYKFHFVAIWRLKAIISYENKLWTYVSSITHDLIRRISSHNQNRGYSKKLNFQNLNSIFECLHLITNLLI